MQKPSFQDRKHYRLATQDSHSAPLERKSEASQVSVFYLTIKLATNSPLSLPPEWTAKHLAR